MSRNVEKILKGKERFKKELEKSLPAETVEKIWNQTKERLTKIYQENQNLSKGLSMHTDGMIFPAAALYLSIKEFAPELAFGVMETVMKETALAGGKSFANMTKLPGGKAFFLKMWNTMSHKMFGDSSGFKNVFYPCKKGEFKMDITACPYNTYLTKLGCPELTILFCKNDEYAYGNIPGIKFSRSKTIGAGDNLCDFKLERI